MIRPSHQLRLISRPVTAANATIEMNRKTRPKPANRLIDPRSVVGARQQLPGLPAVVERRVEPLQVLVQVVLIVFSMPVTALPCTQRRTRLSAAAPAPRAMAARPRGSSRPRSWRVMAPSIRALMTRGIAISAPSTAIAATTMTVSWRR